MTTIQKTGVRNTGLHNSGTVVQRILAMAAVTVLLGLSAGCGSDSDGDDDDALPDAAGASSSASAASGDDETDLDRDDAMLKFAQCMRENGIDMPDPTPGGGMRISGEGVPKEQMEAAQSACQKWMDMAEPDDAGREMSEEEKQQFLDMAACMRDRGYTFPDPTFEGGGVTQRIEKPEGDEPGPADPAFEQDMEECHAEAGLEPPNVDGDGPSEDEQQS
jgi:hypothetical protein